MPASRDNERGAYSRTRVVNRYERGGGRNSDMAAAEMEQVSVALTPA